MATKKEPMALIGLSMFIGLWLSILMFVRLFPRNIRWVVWLGLGAIIMGVM